MWHYRLITADDDIEVYPLPDAETVADYEQRGRIIVALNARHGVPDDWFDTGHGWDVAVLEGDLHPSLVAKATMHDADEVPTGEEP